jgi:hypothetical protein
MGEMVPGVMRKDWSRGRIFYRVVGRRKPGGQEEGGSSCKTSMILVTGDENGEGKSMGCSHFQRGRDGGGETAPLCRRQMTQQRAT